MAGPRTRCRPRQNPPPTGEGELAGGAHGAPGASTNDSGTPTPTSHAPTLAPAPTPGSAPASTDELFKQFMQAYLKALTQPPAQSHAKPREQPLEARPPDLYYGKSYMEYFHFCRQCEDNFDTAGATGANRTPFAASFLRGHISFRWYQHKRRAEGVAPLSWVEFKAFLRKNLSNSRAFVDNTWSKFKRDSQYQQEGVQDWASHLEDLQFILMEFDADVAPGELVLIRFFYEGLKPSIKAEMGPWGTELDNWQKLVAKAVGAEAKAALRPASYFREMDQHCLRGNRPAPTTVA